MSDQQHEAREFACEADRAQSLADEHRLFFERKSDSAETLELHLGKRRVDPVILAQALDESLFALGIQSKQLDQPRRPCLQPHGRFTQFADDRVGDAFGRKREFLLYGFYDHGTLDGPYDRIGLLTIELVEQQMG